jgi:NADH-quinone oxidoreductase subunit I
MICARECPDWCIDIDGHVEVEEVDPAQGRRPQHTNVLDRFTIDYGLCMYCGICVEVCPFDALFWAPDHDYVAGDRAGLIHDAERLASWLPGVSQPPVAP